MAKPLPFAEPVGPVVVRDGLSLESIDGAAWDALVPGHPLLSHAFLTSLHQSECASPATGWEPRYLGAWRDGRLVGALPLYLKLHSWGEYVFDWGWADAYRRHGRRYYPKLVAAIPFTPVAGPRLISNDTAIKRALLDAAQSMVANGEASSLHLLFLDDADASACAGAGMIGRAGVQFRWQRNGRRDFTGFLSTFSHDKRKKVNQDRRRVAEAGVTFARRTGTAITPADWAFFHRCYQTTYRAHRSTPYLSFEFFERIAARMPEHLLMVIGSRDGHPLCAALDVFNADTLWGRYWGTVDTVPGLHFEACYYQAIEFCLERGINCFEGGAQGSHKLARGFTPVRTRSAHAIGEPAFAAAIADYCKREDAEVAHALDELEQSVPFRTDARS